MIDLVAFSSGDGWGLARHDDAWWLLRPPYERASRTPLSDAAASRLLTDGFGSLTDLSFPNWGDAARWMSDERARRADALGLRPTFEDALRLFDYASDEEILEHFAKIEEWIRDGFRHEARRVVEGIVLSPTPRNQSVRTEAQRLLRLAEERRPPPFRASVGYGVSDESRLAEEIDVVHTRGVLSFAPQKDAA
jgi:hypothetical protein